MKAVGAGGLAFGSYGPPHDLSLVPLNRLFGQRNLVYWKVRPA